jgi:hypothetical protein
MSSKPAAKHKLRSWIITILVSCSILCAAFLFPFVKDSLLHDYAFYQETQAFRRLKHPAGTSLVSSKKFLGLYLGNGNHCDYFLGELRRYSSDEQTIKAFYAGRTSADPEVGIMFLENGEFPDNAWNWMPYKFDSLSTWLDTPDEPRDHLYLIYDWGIISLDPGWDLRCG